MYVSFQEPVSALAVGSSDPSLLASPIPLDDKKYPTIRRFRKEDGKLESEGRNHILNTVFLINRLFAVNKRAG